MLRPSALLCLALLLSACASGGPGSTPSTQAVELEPFRTATASLTPTVVPVLTQALPATPTPFIYVVVQGDTLSTIAERLGVSLEALLAANPGVQPSALPLGERLTIPGGNELPGVPTPTPAPLEVSQVRCWSEAAGGLWCFGLLTNSYPQTVENLSARISLLDPGGMELASQTAYGLLDILAPGASMPLAAHFPPPVELQAEPRLQLLTALRLLPGDTRYLPILLENTLVELASGGRAAQVSGQAVLIGEQQAQTVWVLAVAYDQAGSVVGMRRFEASTPLTAQSPLHFSFLVASQGGVIDRVEFLAEARP